MKVKLPKGMGGGPQNMDAMMRKVQQFQAERETLAEDLETREYDVAAGGGAVKIKIGGDRRIKEINIDPEVIDPDDAETLQDIIVAGVNEALSKVEDEAATEMSALAEKYGIPEGAL